MNNLFLITLGLAILTYSLTHVYRITAGALQILDEPDHRSAHTDLTPTGAGIVFVLVFCCVIVLLSNSSVVSDGTELVFHLLPALLIVAAIGFVDDFREMPWWLRLLVHFGAVGWMVFSGQFPLLEPFGLAGLMAGVFSIVWFLNLYNFMDGIDGIAVSESVFVLAAVALISLICGSEPEIAMMILLGVCLGFLLINSPPARVFMGDAGSKFLGLILGSFTFSEAGVSIWVWLILLGWFWVDATLTLVLRFFRQEHIQQAHSQHAYQHLNRALGTARTLLVVHLVNVIWLLPIALYTASHPGLGPYLLLFALIPVVPGLYLVGAGQRSPRLKALKVG